MNLVVVIFVVGKGICMKLDFFKVFYLIVGCFMVQYVVDVVGVFDLDNMVLIYGYGGEVVCQVVIGLWL